ncbi:MAG TPA: DUF4147 domain-containing protein, partial [Vicinamibacterales bacterium]
MREGRRQRARGRHSPEVRRRHRPLGPAGDVGPRPAALTDRRSDLRALAAAAIAAAEPRALLRSALEQDLQRNPSLLRSKVYVVAAGKASAAMLAAFEERMPVAKAVRAAGSHPLPDAASVQFGLEALTLAREAREADGDLVVLLSGGASAMLAAPADGVTLELKREITRRLLAAGAPIHDLNAVRKHLSRIKGGRLAMDMRCTSFALSDVTDDGPASIGSGPTVGDPSTMADAKRVLERMGIARELPEAIEAIDRAGESPKPGDRGLSQSRFVLIGGRRTAMDGAVNAALERDLSTIVLDEPITGEAAAAGAAFARRAIAAAERIGGAVMVVASGETTVTVRGPGTGGRNQEFALGAAVGIDRRDSSIPDRPFCIAAVGTDGIDGNSP